MFDRRKQKIEEKNNQISRFLFKYKINDQQFFI